MPGLILWLIAVFETRYRHVIADILAQGGINPDRDLPVALSPGEVVSNLLALLEYDFVAPKYIDSKMQQNYRKSVDQEIAKRDRRIEELEDTLRDYENYFP